MGVRGMHLDVLFANGLRLHVAWRPVQRQSGAQLLSIQLLQALDHEVNTVGDVRFQVAGGKIAQQHSLQGKRRCNLQPA